MRILFDVSLSNDSALGYTIPSDEITERGKALDRVSGSSLVMESFHGFASVNSEGNVIVSVPFPKGQRVEIVARPVDDSHQEGKAWERMSLHAFFEGYADEDAIYDNYPEWRTASR